MNDDNRRIKQINRIAVPIKVNTNGEKIEENKNVVVNKQINKKEKKHINFRLNVFLKIVLGILIIAILVCIFVIIKPSITLNSELHYNDVLPTSETSYPITSIYINGGVDVYSDYSYNVDDNFTMMTVENDDSIDIVVNNVIITNAKYLCARVFIIDDLLLFMTSNVEDKTTKLYAVTESGDIVLDLYNVGDIDGMSLENTSSLSTNEYNMVLNVTRVIGSNIYYTNDMYDNSHASICDEDAMFAASIETTKPVRIYYILEYKGNHEFSLEVEYEEYLEHYISKNNLCN